MVNFIRGVTGHFDGEEPWTLMEEKIKPLMANLVGNNLLLFILFYFLC